MNRLFSNRFLPFDQNNNTQSELSFDHLHRHAGADMPELIPQAVRDQMILESREALLARLTRNQQDQNQPVQDGTAAYHEMMARIESSEISSSLAEEFDDFMNPQIAVQHANST